MSEAENNSSTFESRLFIFYDELKWLHSELYNNDERAFVEYVALLKEFYMRLELKKNTDTGTGSPSADAETLSHDAPESAITRFTGHDRIGVFTGLKRAQETACPDRESMLGVRRVDIPAEHVYPSDRWDFKYRGAKALKDFTADILQLCVKGERTIRLSADPCMPGAEVDFPGARTVIRILRMAVQIVCPGTVLVGDTNRHNSISAAGFGTDDKPSFDVIYNDAMMATIWHTVATCDARLIKHLLQDEFHAPKKGIFLNYLSDRGAIDWSLDYDYLGQFGINEQAHRKFLNDFYTGAWPGSPAQGVLLTGNSGMTYTSGSVASLCGIEYAETAGDPMALARARTLYIMLHALLFTLSGMPVLNPMDARGTWGSDDRETDSERGEGVFKALSRLAQLRADHSVFDNNADVWLLETWNDRVLGIGRYYEGEKLLALFNFGDNAETAWIDEAEPYTDLFTDAFREARMVEIPSRDYIWLVTKF